MVKEEMKIEINRDRQTEIKIRKYERRCWREKARERRREKARERRREKARERESAEGN